MVGSIEGLPVLVEKLLCFPASWPFTVQDHMFSRCFWIDSHEKTQLKPSGRPFCGGTWGLKRSKHYLPLWLNLWRCAFTPAGAFPAKMCPPPQLRSMKAEAWLDGSCALKKAATASIFGLAFWGMSKQPSWRCVSLRKRLHDS